MNKSTYSKSEGMYPLTGITSTWMHDMMKNRQFIEDCFEEYESPINFLDVSSYAQNINNFKDVFNRYKVKSQIYFARKANKNSVLVKEALNNGIGVDTASFRELEEAIALGGNGSTLILTAAVKNKKLLTLAIKNDIPIMVDNLDELQLINKVAAELKTVAIIGIRLSGFTCKGKKLYSRFGFDIEKDVYHLKVWLSDRESFGHVRLEGVHFHLDGYSTEQRAEAILQCLDVIKELRHQGHVISFLDIGGGILMNYLQSKTEWLSFQEHLKDCVQGLSTPITFNNQGLGFTLDKERKIQGTLNTYPYFGETSSTKFIASILDYKDDAQITIAERLQDANLEIRIEPGRSLLNQVGITMAKVAHRKRDALGNWLIGLEMNMSQLQSSSADFLVDPYLIYNEEEENQQAAEVYLTGAFCLEKDIILKRKLHFSQLPSRGDVIVFVNTAGYLMHFYETQSHLCNPSTDLFVSYDDAKANYKIGVTEEN